MKKVSFSILFLLSVFIISPAFVHGAEEKQELFGKDGKIIDILDKTGIAAGFDKEQRGKEGRLELVAVRVINATLGLFGIVFTALLIYGGWLWMTAAGNQERVDHAKKVLQWAVIGIAIVLISVSISLFVSNSLITATGGIVN